MSSSHSTRRLRRADDWDGAERARRPPRARCSPSPAPSPCGRRTSAGCCSPAASATRSCSALLVVAELFNVVQALGFWWTCARRRAAAPPVAGPTAAGLHRVDVFIPTYTSRCDIVEPTVAAAGSARRARPGAPCSTTATATRWSAWPPASASRTSPPPPHGAKAGNINHALGRADAPYVLVLDCDHVPDPRRARSDARRSSPTPGRVRPDAAVLRQPRPTRSPARRGASRRCSSDPSPTARTRHRSMFCCGTNVVVPPRRARLHAGGFPHGLGDRGLRTVRRPAPPTAGNPCTSPEPLAAGYGPEDLAAYLGQQHRWAHGCLGMIPTVLRTPAAAAQGSCSTCCRRRTSFVPAGPSRCTWRCP